MLRKLLNHAELEIALEPAEPILVASGVPNEAGISLPFVRTYRGATDTGEPYLPGSSLKGILRSHAERVSRALAPEAGVCDPHHHETGDHERSSSVLFCGDQLRPRENGGRSTLESHDLYRRSCPICRTFGSTVYRGRLAVGDAYLKDGATPGLEQRDGVGIDRFSGGASKSVKFEMEVLTHGTFHTRLRLENFEDWQMGLLALLCRDLEDGLLSIGHATTRGLGRLRGRVEQLRVMYIVPPGKVLDERLVHGVGSLLGADERGLYGYRSDDHFSLSQPPQLQERSIRREQSFAAEALQRAFFDDAIAGWAERMKTWRRERWSTGSSRRGRG